MPRLIEAGGGKRVVEAPAGKREGGKRLIEAGGGRRRPLPGEAEAEYREEREVAETTEPLVPAEVAGDVEGAETAGPEAAAPEQAEVSPDPETAASEQPEADSGPEDAAVSDADAAEEEE